MNTPTPETDALAIKAGITITNTLIWEHARKLERERDEARSELKHHQTIHGAICLPSDVPESYSQVKTERDQLRKVADELASAIKEHGQQMNENPVWTDSLSTAIQSYNSLPHVVAQKGNK